MHQLPILRQAKEVVRFEEAKVGCGVVARHGDRNAEQPPLVGELAPGRACKLDPRVVLTLQLVLVLHNEFEVADVVEDDRIVDASLKLLHGGREDLRHA